MSKFLYRSISGLFPNSSIIIWQAGDSTCEYEDVLPYTSTISYRFGLSGDSQISYDNIVSAGTLVVKGMGEVWTFPAPLLLSHLFSQ
jgi:hypothetical protein